MSDKYIGSKKIKETVETEEKTPSGFNLIEVEFEDGTKEWFSPLMFNKIVSEESCDVSILRDRRISPVIEVMLTILRDWGIKMGELPYLSVLLNQSLDFNQREAMQELWSQWMPKPLSLDDVDMITVDRVLKSIKKDAPK